MTEVRAARENAGMECEETKVCSRCKNPKPLSEFHYSKAAACKRKPACKDCANLATNYSRKSPASKARASEYQKNRNKRPEIKKINADRQRELRNADPLFVRRAALVKYGLTIDSYEAKLAAQGGVCMICGLAESAVDRSTKKTKPLAIDHRHDRGRVAGQRGLLCHKCNAAIGFLGESVENLESAIAYLIYWRHEHAKRDLTETG